MSDNILLVWDRMGDYHRARWIAIQSAFDDRSVYAADLGGRDNIYGWENTYDSQNHFQLSVKAPDQFDWRRIINFIRLVWEYKIGVICIAGYGRLEYILFLLYGKLSRRQVVLFAESWYPSGQLIDRIKSYFLRFSCDGFLVSGVRAQSHFHDRLRVPLSKIRTGYSVVDNRYFSTPPAARGAMKKKRILCVARFSKEKNLIFLVNAFEKSRLINFGWDLMIIGGGPIKNEIRNNIRGGSVAIEDWQSYEDMPVFYHEASVFILPSIFEPWGLVVNEAMAAALPIILSEEAGCGPDLVRNNQNGWTFSPMKEEELILIFDKLARLSVEDLVSMGLKSKERIEEFSTEQFAKNLKALITQKAK